MKEPKCKICGGPHYKTWCFQAPKKSIKVNKPTFTRSQVIMPKPVKPLKRYRIKPRSDSVRSRLIREADRIFSIYIRLSNSTFGRARCVTCGYIQDWSAMQNGHFISRRKMPTRWDEINCHVQCPYCNETLGGNMNQYRVYMNSTYGIEAVDQLRLKSMAGDKVTNDDIQRVIDIYTMKVAEFQS